MTLKTKFFGSSELSSFHYRDATPIKEVTEKQVSWLFFPILHASEPEERVAEKKQQRADYSSVIIA